jgi:protein-S-isoprenylcysteine O-methyltransferase Ste14
MNSVAFIAIAVGILLGAGLGFVGSRVVARVFLSRRWVAGGALTALAPAFFLAFVIGGNFGGSYSAAALGSPVPGLAFGVALVLGGVVVGGAILGGVIGRIYGVRFH